MEVRVLFSFLNDEPGAEIGKLYVTNSVFSNGIGGLCAVMLHLFLPSVKPLPRIIGSIEVRRFLEPTFAESPPSLCNNPSGP